MNRGYLKPRKKPFSTTGLGHVFPVASGASATVEPGGSAAVKRGPQPPVKNNASVIVTFFVWRPGAYTSQRTSSLKSTLCFCRVPIFLPGFEGLSQPAKRISTAIADAELSFPQVVCFFEVRTICAGSGLREGWSGLFELLAARLLALPERAARARPFRPCLPRGRDTPTSTRWLREP